MCRHFDVTENLFFLHSRIWGEFGELNVALQILNFFALSIVLIFERMHGALNVG
jgi:hypothetical protein